MRWKLGACQSGLEAYYVFSRPESWENITADGGISHSSVVYNQQHVSWYFCALPAPCVPVMGKHRQGSRSLHIHTNIYIIIFCECSGGESPPAELGLIEWLAYKIPGSSVYYWHDKWNAHSSISCFLVYCTRTNPKNKQGLIDNWVSHTLVLKTSLQLLRKRLWPTHPTPIGTKEDLGIKCHCTKT
jgi:hypothetical protein